MKRRAHVFVHSVGTVRCEVDPGVWLALPVIPGLLKHPTEAELFRLLEDPRVARKYTDEALRRAPWSAVRAFPRMWLEERLRAVELPPGRRSALEFMLRASGGAEVT